MPKSHRPYPPEFRQRIIELVRKGRTPEELSRQITGAALPLVGRISTINGGHRAPPATRIRGRVLARRIPILAKRLVHPRWLGENELSSDMLNPTTLALLVGVTLLSTLWTSPEGTPAQAAETWGWFSAVSAVDKWYVSQGKASVDVSGKRFTAKLLRDDGTVHIVLSGTLQNGQLTVTATELESDSPPRRLQGTVKTTKWVDGAGGRRAVLLIETGVTGGLVIGLTIETK